LANLDGNQIELRFCWKLLSWLNYTPICKYFVKNFDPGKKKGLCSFQKKKIKGLAKKIKESIDKSKN